MADEKLSISEIGFIKARLLSRLATVQNEISEIQTELAHLHHLELQTMQRSNVLQFPGSKKRQR